MINTLGNIINKAKQTLNKEYVLEEDLRYLLQETFSLSPSDFSSLFLRYLFAAIDNLYNGGATRITPVDISNYLESSPSGQIVFKENNGIEYLQDAEYMCEEDNFPYYYKELKKINLVKDLKRMGFDTSQIYCENLTQPKAFEINQRFKALTTADILKEVKKKLLNVEKEYTQNETVQTWDLENEIDSVIELADGSWCAFEIKLGANQIDNAANNLVNVSNKIKENGGIPPKVMCVICGLSNAAYKRCDGVYVIPITALKN